MRTGTENGQAQNGLEGIAQSEDALRLHGLMKEQWGKVGEKAPPGVVTVDNVSQIPEALAGEQAPEEVRTGKTLEAYFITTEEADGSPGRRIVLVRDGAAAVATHLIPQDGKVGAALALHAQSSMRCRRKYDFS